MPLEDYPNVAFIAPLSADPTEDDLYPDDTPVHAMGMNALTVHGLTKAGLLTAGQLRELRRAGKLLGHKGIGQGRAAQIEAALDRPMGNTAADVSAARLMSLASYACRWVRKAAKMVNQRYFAEATAPDGWDQQKVVATPDGPVFRAWFRVTDNPRAAASHIPAHVVGWLRDNPHGPNDNRFKVIRDTALTELAGE